MDAESNVEGLLLKAYDNLKASDATGAQAALEEALKVDFEAPEVVYALKCVNWWSDRLSKIEGIRDGYERGEGVMELWKSFQGFLDRIGRAYDRCVYAIRMWVFGYALECYQELMADLGDQQEADLYLKLGRCYKGTGNYERALAYLEEASRLKRDDAELLAELADAYALVNEPRLAKALFREAFFANPRKVDLRLMDSELIKLLAAKVQELGYRSPELEEWLPIYGVLFGVFNVKRELRAIEIGKLKQSIFALENEVKLHPEDGGTLVPRLINRYFWLIDHYVNANEDKARVDETLLKIKLLDPAVYERYIN